MILCGAGWHLRPWARLCSRPQRGRKGAEAVDSPCMVDSLGTLVLSPTARWAARIHGLRLTASHPAVPTGAAGPILMAGAIRVIVPTGEAGHTSATAGIGAGDITADGMAILGGGVVG